jgi:hypothetical protein
MGGDRLSREFGRLCAFVQFQRNVLHDKLSLTYHDDKPSPSSEIDERQATGCTKSFWPLSTSDGQAPAIRFVLGMSREASDRIRVRAELRHRVDDDCIEPVERKYMLYVPYHSAATCP